MVCILCQVLCRIAVGRAFCVESVEALAAGVGSSPGLPLGFDSIYVMDAAQEHDALRGHRRLWCIVTYVIPVPLLSATV